MPQQPAEAPTGGEDTQTPTTPTQPPTGGEEPQPIPPVTPPDGGDTGGTDGGQPSGGETGGGETPGGGESGTTVTGNAYLGFLQPFDAVTAAPGDTVNLVFTLALDLGTSVASAEVIVARDDDADRQPDAEEPVYTQEVTDQVEVGENTLTFDTQALDDAGLLTGGFGRFLIGLRVVTNFNKTASGYAPGTVTVDAQRPQAADFRAGPTAGTADQEDHLIKRSGTWTLLLSTTDNGPHTVRIMLDPDLAPESGNEVELVNETVEPGEHTFTVLISAYPVGTYYYYYTVTDGLGDATGDYGKNAVTDARFRLALTDRLVGLFDLEQLTDSPYGAIMQGFNFNDLAGSSLATSPSFNDDNQDGSIDGDDLDEIIIGSRFGKAYLIQYEGVGFGEAYLIYGSTGRLRGTWPLNAVGRTIDGLAFPGIRTPLNAPFYSQNESTGWTAGLSDITVIPDMDGDNLPELVFSFPRVESINLGKENEAIQPRELWPDISGMGELEYDAYYPPMAPSWHENEAQFTRGGIVIVSSHNEILRYPSMLNRKSDRVLDLHEVGQLFSSMSRPSLVPYIFFAESRGVTCADCDMLPPDGCEAGDEGDPMDPDDDTPGNCGDDGCAVEGTVAELQDGRETLLSRYVVYWDVVFSNQGPGGFQMSWTTVPADPPLANPGSFPFDGMTVPFPFLGYPTYYPNRWMEQGGGGLACEIPCEVTNVWWSWFPVLPGTTLSGTPSWATEGQPDQDPLPECYSDNVCETVVPPEEGDCPEDDPDLDCPNPEVTVAAGSTCAWTGFFSPTNYAVVSVGTGESFPTPIGARVLGQKVNDRFGTAVASDGTWLYISAPERTVNEAYPIGSEDYVADVPTLGDRRVGSGVVYQLRTYAPAYPGGPTRTQLWLERSGGFSESSGWFVTDLPTWPNVDVEDPDRTDYTMPIPHQYIIESVGSIRGNASFYEEDKAFDNGDCPPAYNPGTNSADASAVYGYEPYPVGTAGYYMDRTPQIVGPHLDAHLSYVKALGDLNNDGVRDFAVGSADIRQTVVTEIEGMPPIVTWTGPVVGSVFIVFGRPSGLEGDLLLEQLALDVDDPARLAGVLVQGESSGEKLARVFDDAGDFNGDGIDDVIIGNEGAESDTGEAIVLFGSTTLTSPVGGWRPSTIPAGQAVRFHGEAAGDLAGANVAGAGDVDHDGYDDILIAAPGAEGGKGVVYLVYGSPELTGDILLADIGTVDLPGVKFIGRAEGDALGGGSKEIEGTIPGSDEVITVYSRGVARLGDIDGDGNGDFAISAMLADPNGKTDAGEVYIIYGQQGP